MLFLATLILVAVGVAAIGLPFYFGSPWWVQAVCAVLGLVAIGGSLWSTAIAFFYRRTSANEAFVRTGRGGSRVVLDSGDYVFPVFHRVIPVSLETMKLSVNPKGTDALITRDNLRADVMAQFYIRVQPDREHVLNAARSLGERSVNALTVEELVSEKLVSALRAIASQMDLFDIHTRRDDFAERVKEHVRADLDANGLWLESVTVSQLDQTDPSMLADTNVFDAQGKRKITEITAAALVERNTLERDAEQARKVKDVTTRQRILMLEQQQAEAEETQAVQVANIHSQKEREQKEFAIEQQRAVDVAAIEKERAVQAAQIERERAIIVSEQERQQTEIERTKALEVAERQKQVAIAQQEAARALAEQQALAAEAEREKANQALITVQEMGVAEREAQKKLVAARQVIEQERIKRQTDVEVAAFSVTHQAEAEREAAEARGKAQVTLAEADSEAKRLAAESDQRLKMVDVSVAREEVDVERVRVEVGRQELENKQTFEKAAIDFERAKLEITAQKEIQIAIAGAVGQALSKAHFQVYGDPNTMAQMISQLSKGLGLGAALDGALLGLPEEVKHAASAAAQGLAGVVARAVAGDAEPKPALAASPNGEREVPLAGSGSAS